MLQEATKLLNNAFHQSFIKRLSLYLHDCVREEVKSATFRDLNQDKDNKWAFLDDNIGFSINPQTAVKLDGSNNVFTELMIHSDTSQKEKYLIFGFFFIEGRSGRKKGGDFLTPLFYVPCKLERSGTNICCTLSEDTISLNTGALAGLLTYDNEDEAEHLFGGLIDVVPDFPLTEEKLDIFLTTLKALIPNINMKECAAFTSFSSENNDSDIFITPKTAIILTKRPSITAGVLHELTQISEKSSGLFRETALYPINEEYMGGKSLKINQKPERDFFPVTPLPLSDSQLQVLRAIEENPLVTVFGPPGTGKSQTIVNLISHLVANGKTVLVASRMDKAVDVVSERLNSLGAPYLSLRAGRINYQKQLNFQLQDLLSNKIDFETGFESAVFADLDDMKALVKEIKDTENRCEEIIKLEHQWFSVLEEYKKLSERFNDNIIPTSKLSDAEIEKSRALLAKIENSIGKSGLLTPVFNKIQTCQLNKSLMIKELEYSFENINALRDELNIKELFNKLKIVEASINKLGNLHQMLENITDLRKKQNKLAINILKNKRRKALKEIVRDQDKRRRLLVHSKALVERKKNLQSRLLEDEDFQPLLEAFPCWAVTTYAISESLPLKPGLFDVAIIDEASQCDIASCFPVLFRAKKAVIVGDDKQLPHLSFLEKAKEQSFLSQYDIPDKYQLMWRFRTNSVFDLANYYSTSPVLLDEHFRSRLPIIDFSNQEFYGGRIRIMNKELDVADSVELHVIKDAKVDLDNTKNMAETEKVLEKLQEIILKDNEENPDNPTSIGIISPFRGQVELIKKAVAQVFSDSVVKKHQLEIGTAHTFQGDEKDIILLSFTLAPNSHVQSLTFLQKPNLFNVAITRAKKKLICFISKPPEDLQPGLLRSYLSYIKEFSLQNSDENKLKIETKTYNNTLEKEIAELCIEEGLEVITGFESAGFRLDMIVSDGEKQLVLECDGQEDKITKPVKQVWKQSVLERCGWKIIRITAREWYYSKNTCIDRIKRNLTEI
ncbi:MAG: AAA domain-containing protein [Candidatus Gastranaerophilaceae bacterium]|jgi:very-short-patch-repair endonuclease